MQLSLEYHGTVLFLLSAVLLLLWFIITSFISWYRLRRVPGPFFASVSYLWIARAILSCRMDKVCIRLKEYGPLVRISPNVLLTHDPATLRQIWAARTKYGKGMWYRTTRFEANNEHLQSTLDLGLHDRLKAQVANGYNGRDNVDLEGCVDTQISSLIGLIRRDYLSRENETNAADFVRLIRYLGLDITSHAGYGQEFGFLKANDDLFGLTKAFDEFAVAVALTQEVPLLRRLTFSSLMDRFLPRPTDGKGLGRIMGIVHEIIDSRFLDNDNSHKDMIGSFMRHGLTRRECHAESILQLLAGFETTAQAMRATLLHIFGTPRVYQRLKEEIQAATRSGRASSPIKHSEAKNLPYLQAVIYEGLRMRPPVLFGHHKQVPPEGDTINDIFVPGGTDIGHNFLAMMRLEDIFRSDVEVFRPERFMDSDEATRTEMLHTVELIFGGGRWSCAGKQLAFIELNKIYFELLRVFDFQLVFPGKAWSEESVVLWMHKDMWVRITETSLSFD
ncbi:cytochrome P450 [Thozetella sp. PMI_491]|nr:cytochrome P450 [Thozetella sp. PMI_491]